MSDWAALFTTGMPGVVTGTAVLADGSVTSVTGQWWKEADHGGGVIEYGRMESRFEALTADLGELARGDLLVISSETYKITQAMDDGHGVTTLFCEPVSSSALPTTALYWRLVAAEPSWADAYGGYLQALRSVEMYVAGEPSGADVAATAVSYAASSTAGGNLASYAADGDTDTYWESGSADTAPWWRIKLRDTALPVRSVRLRVFDGFFGVYGAKSYKLQSSDSGASWTDVATFSTEETDEWQSFANLQ